jgi:predicted ATP-dependent endonuclease of OLD family
MPYIHSIKISNFRGICNLEHTFGDSRFVVLIGRGDSGKTTILKAIALALCPYWNPTISISDFHNGDTSKPIVIQLTIGDVPKELLSEQKFGLYCQLLNGDTITDNVLEEGADQSTLFLTVKLLIEKDLSPHWFVSNGREGEEDKEISPADRAKFNMFFISDYVDNHFTYSKGSPLYALVRNTFTDDSEIETKLLELSLKANESISKENGFQQFNAPLGVVNETVRTLGLEIADLKALIEIKDNVYNQSSISLHNSNIPIHTYGKGSKRLLSIAIQLSLVQQGGILLIDEVEQGLEPDRIVNLVRHLQRTEKGQIFITTHSSEALCEADYNELFIVNPQKGKECIQACKKDLQPLLRNNPSSFFAKRIICCEGKTEVGLLRGLDVYLQKNKGRSFSSNGVWIADCGGGEQHLDSALLLHSMGYDVSVFCDNDITNNDSYKLKLNDVIDNGIPVFKWSDGKCCEEQLLSDIPWPEVIQLVSYVLAVNETEALELDTGTIIHATDRLEVFDEDSQLIYRDKLAKRAKMNKKKKSTRWFKDIDGGECLCQAWLNSLPAAEDTSVLKTVFQALTTWIQK